MFFEITFDRDKLETCGLIAKTQEHIFINKIVFEKKIQRPVL